MLRFAARQSLASPFGLSGLRGLRVMAGREDVAERYRLRSKRVGGQPHPQPEAHRVYSEPATVVHAPWEGSGALLDRSFAVVQISGAQHKVTPGDVVIVPRVHAAVVGSEFALEDVLLVGSATRTVIGRPLVPAAKVVAMCEEHSRTKKVIVFKKKRRKGYQRTRGFRQHVTVFRIDRIECDLDAFAWPKPGDVPDPAQALAAAKAAPPHTAGEGAVASDMVDSIARAE